MNHFIDMAIQNCTRRLMAAILDLVQWGCRAIRSAYLENPTLE